MHKIASVGSISEGTLRTVDLLTACADEYECLVYPEKPTLLHDARKYIDILNDDPSSDDEINATEILFDIENCLNDYAPPYCYFGSLEGDGAAIGFWPLIELIAELPHIADPSDAETMEEDCVYVNDHGNVTVYNADGDILLEIV